MTGLVYGIDFGTSDSAAVVRRPDGAEVRVTDPAAVRGGWSIPTAVALGRDGATVVGWAAERAKLSRPASYRSEFKRDIGDPTPVQHGERRLAADDLAVEVLRFVREQAGAQVPGDVERVAIAVPASWERTQRDLMLGAAARAGFDPATLTLVEEPVAAAHAAGDEDGTVVVYDLGGGTFDCAVARVRDGRREVLGAPGGLDDVGGAALDRAVLAELRRRFPDETDGLLGGPADDPSVLRRRLQLRSSCEELKVALSVVPSTDAFLTELTPPVETTLTRDELAVLLEPMVHRTLAECDRVLERVGFGWSDIDRVVPVGGSTRLSLVVEALAEHTGRPVVVVDDPELAVAVGAGRALDAASTADALKSDSRRTERERVFVAATPSRLWPQYNTIDLPSLTITLLGRSRAGKTSWLMAARRALQIHDDGGHGLESSEEDGVVIGENVPDREQDRAWSAFVGSGEFPPITRPTGALCEFVLGVRSCPLARVRVFDVNGGRLLDRSSEPDVQALITHVTASDSLHVVLDGEVIGDWAAGDLSSHEARRRLLAGRMTTYVQVAVVAREARGLPMPSLVLLITKIDVVKEKNADLGPTLRWVAEELEKLLPVAYQPGVTAFLCPVQLGRFGSELRERVDTGAINLVGVHRPLVFSVRERLAELVDSSGRRGSDSVDSVFESELRGQYIVMDGRLAR